MGSGNIVSAKIGIRRSLIIEVVFLIISIIVLYIFRFPFYHFFVNIDEVVKTMDENFIYYLVYLFVDGV